MKYNDLYRNLAAAVIRGRASRERITLPPELTETPLTELSEDSADRLWDMGRAWGMKLYRFKRGHEDLPRVKLVLGDPAGRHSRIRYLGSGDRDLL